MDPSPVGSFPSMTCGHFGAAARRRSIGRTHHVHASLRARIFSGPASRDRRRFKGRDAATSDQRLSSTQSPGASHRQACGYGYSRGAHFKAANEALLTEMKASPGFASAIEGLGIKVPTSGAETALQRSPVGWTWHHLPDQPGVMQLVPTPQHQGGPWQALFHPGGVGGFKLWGADF